MSAGAVLEVLDLGFGFPGEVPLFSGWSATLGPGLHRLEGESGSGKSSLLRLLAGELPAGLAGHSAVTGQRVLNGLDAQADPAAWRRAVCLIDARDAALDDLTPAALRDRVASRHPQLDLAAWQRQFNGFGLAPHGAKTLHMLSTGMRRKAALAAVLSSGAALILLDEPLAGLDTPSVAWLLAELTALSRQPQRAALIVCGSWPPGLPCASSIDLSS